MKILIIHRKGLAQSVMSDVATFTMLLGCIGIGIWVGSAALQWAGFVVFFMSVFAMRAVYSDAPTSTETFDGAREIIDRMEREEG